MFQPESYAAAFLLMVLSMLCWGSWANSMKLCPGYRFQLFYWDYVIGLIAGALLWGLSLGCLGSEEQHFVADVFHAGISDIFFAVLGGILFNIANLLLVSAIEIAGLAVAFPVGIGIALVVGAVSSYIITPSGNPVALFGGIGLVVLAIILDAIAYRLRETDRRSFSIRGVIISLLAGILMGGFYPLVSRAMTGKDAPGPYATSLFFVFGVALCAIPINLLLMRWPLDGGEAISLHGYARAQGSWHVWGIFGGFVWCTGAVFNFVASRTHIVGPAVSYSIGQGATMISAAWGVFIWKEFATAPRQSKIFLGWMFVLFISGLSSIALAPILK